MTQPDRSQLVSLGLVSRWDERWSQRGTKERVFVEGELLADLRKSRMWFRPKDSPTALYPLFDDSPRPDEVIETLDLPTRAEAELFLRRVRRHEPGPPDSSRPLVDPVDFGWLRQPPRRCSRPPSRTSRAAR